MNQARVLSAGLVQLNVGDDPAGNLSPTLLLIRQAASQGAEIVLTPEVTNMLSPDRARQQAMLQREDDDPTLAALREAGADILVSGSAIFGTEDPVASARTIAGLE